MRATPSALMSLALVGLLNSACTDADAHRQSPTPSASSVAAASPATRIDPSRIRATGELIVRQIPGGASHFASRNAEIYLPPAAVRDPQLRLPVLELLHGTPGGPLGWLELNRGRLLPTLEAFARSHRGRTPIVVLPDINGTTTADSECIRTEPGGDVEQYLSSIVPQWIAAHLPATSDHHDWAIAGLSEGGTCSLMLALRHRATFATVGDFAGLAHLTLGEHWDRQRTVNSLFDGSQRAYDEHDPLWLIARARHLQKFAIWMQSGAKDQRSREDQALLTSKIRAAGGTVRAVLYPGLGHQWPVWANAVKRMLPWWWQRISA